jgi:hypothetical protein
MGLKFSPRLGQSSYENDMATLVPRLDLDYSLGFTVCVRVLFKYLNRNCVLESETFHLAFRDYKSAFLGIRLASGF